MRGRAEAPGAATVINAIATLRGGAFAIDIHTTAEVEITDSVGVTGEINREGSEDTDTQLIERCAELVLRRFNLEKRKGAHVSTTTEIPVASGLKSSSAAANATVLATLDAIDEALDPMEATRVGVEAARDTGVTVTGAMDDAAASMLGGIVLTDNSKDEVLKRDETDWEVAVYVPEERAYTSETDIGRSKVVGPVVDRAFELALEGEYADAMTINGLAYCAALGYDPSVAVDALKHTRGAGLSGTGPSYSAIGNAEQIDKVVEEWKSRQGKVLRTKTNNKGARS
ncbi:MAG: shikimate kinase [Halobacteria archaeon]|nr:shikimate kinase [Halobacteria archaeon]